MTNEKFLSDQFRAEVKENIPFWRAIGILALVYAPGIYIYMYTIFNKLKICCLAVSAEGLQTMLSFLNSHD